MARSEVDAEEEFGGFLGFVERLGRGWFLDAPEGARQLPTTILLVISAVAIVSAVPSPSFPLLNVAGALVVAAQALASFVPWDRLPYNVRYVVPLTHIVAIGLMDIATGLNHSALDALLVLPLVGLALRSGLLPLVCGLAACGIMLVMPAVLGVDRIAPLVYACVTLVILATVGVRAHGTVAMVRSQSRRLEVAQAEIASRARELQASRDTLRSIMKAATEQAIMGTDQRGVIDSVSTGAVRMFRRSEDELLGTDVTSLLASGTSPSDPEAAGPSSARLAALVGEAARGVAHVAETEVADGDGRSRHLEYVVTSRPGFLTVQPSHPVGYVFVVTDVSARWEEERRQDEFISLVSHEFRTPLASLLGYVELFRLEEESLSNDQREYLDVLERNAQRLRLLVDDLLTSAQLVFGVPLAPVLADIVQVVRESVKGQAPAARAADMQVDVTGEPAVWLMTDAQRVGQVVDNLISNAVKYGLRGGQVVVTVHSATTEAGARAARISVADDGPGIPPDELTRITERFYRTRDSRRRRVGGMGLGLSLVQAVVQEHGGEMSINSTPGEGTTVELFLPDLAVTSSTPTPSGGPPSDPASSGTEG